VNQSILFTDLQHWDEASSSVCFVAQYQGVNIDCYISMAKLVAMADEPASSAQEALALFDAQRFDIEDEAEALIEAEAFDELGAIRLG
jgi:hypothetical protein